MTYYTVRGHFFLHLKTRLWGENWYDISMKILLTGKPKSGKKTLLNKLLEGVTDKRGMAATEILEAGVRVGFDLQDNLGRTAILARTDHQTDTAVGRYYVDIPSLNDFIAPLFEYAPGQLLYIDEIGHMQLYSDEFQKLVRSYLSAPNDYLGTISCIYDHPFIDEVKDRTDILLCTITSDNRDAVFAGLALALKNRTVLAGLPAAMQAKVLALARSYLQAESYISLKKLFGNAIVYVAKNRVKQISDKQFIVQGNHDEHRVDLLNGDYSCDCDFFNGRQQFAGKAGECSHIQAVSIFVSH